MKYLYNLLLVLFASFTAGYSQEIFIDRVDNSCPDPDILTVCLGNNNSYEGQYTYRTFDHFCGEEITGTLRIFRDERGDYFIDDFSFGTWPFCYGIEGPRGTLRLNIDCNTVEGISGTDNYGDIWGTEDVVYTGQSLIIKWFNSYPEYGTTELTPLDGRVISEPESFLESEFSFNWSTGENRQTIQVNEPGFYSVTVQGPNGFNDIANITISEDEAVFNPECSGEILDLSYFMDDNQDGIMNPGEEPIPTGENYVRLNPEEKYASFEEKFRERYILEPGEYLLQDVHPEMDFTLSDPVIEIAPSGGVIPLSIGLYKNKDVRRADYNITSINPERCNRVVPFRITIKNTGTVGYEDRFSLDFDPLISFVSTDEDPILNEPGLLAWDISLPKHGQEHTISLLLQMPGGEHTGSIFCLLPSGSSNEKSNTDFCFELRCAYDPNDKHGTPFRGDRNLCLFDEELKYTIRFENLGNDTAFDIRIEDQLHNAFDLNSFKLLQSSHPVSRHFIDHNRKLSIFFDNILLPSKEQDSLNNKGFVQFAIKTRPNLPEEAVINNTAGIFFDFNDPVITNQTRHTMVSSFGTTSSHQAYPDVGKVLKIWPNPSGEYIYIDIDESWINRSNVLLYRIDGICTHKQILSSERLDVSLLAEGMYFVRIMNSAGELLASGRFVRD